jgi:phage-related tail fiber protein
VEDCGVWSVREFGLFEKEGKLLHTMKKLDREMKKKVKKGARMKNNNKKWKSVSLMGVKNGEGF